MGGIWSIGIGLPGVFARQAAKAEAEGWDGIAVVDSQNLSGDPYIAMAQAAAETSSIGLATGVTNSVTRHPAATASAVATVQAISGGRAVLGIGRGDSALAHLGLAPAPVAEFEDYLARVQGYLRGDDVPLDDSTVGRLRLAGAPTTSKIHWLRSDQPKVPVDVAATGPKVIAAAARHADRITFAVGADPERVSWAMATAKAAAGGRTLDFGAFVNVVVHDDADTALELGSGGLASFARFSVMHGTVSGPADEATASVLTDVHAAYDMNRHTQAGTAQAAALTPEFAARFAVLGPPDHCIARLRALLDLGLDKLVVIGGSAGADREAVSRAHRRFADEVLPALRA